MNNHKQFYFSLRMPTSVKTSKQILMKDASTFTFGDKIWVGVHMLSQITVNKYKKTCFDKRQIAQQNSMFFLSPTERFGGYSDEPGVRPSSVRPFVRPFVNIFVSALLNLVLNILMILHSYVEQVMICAYKNESPCFNSFELSPL